MGAAFTAEEIMEITEARIAVGLMHEDVGEICTDTRSLREGQWFLALGGEEFDGHDFLGEAFSCGAIGCIVEERTNYPIASTSFPLLAVPDTADALRKLARNWRKRINPRIALLPADDSLEALIGTLSGDFSHHFKEHFVFLPKSGCLDIFKQLLAMRDDTRAILIQYQLDKFDEVDALGSATIPSVVMLTEESVRAFRLQLSDADLAAIPFSIMPTLKLSHGLLIVDSSFRDQLLGNVNENFLRNILIFGESLSEADVSNADASNADTVEFLRAAGADEKLSALLSKAKGYAGGHFDADGQYGLLELAAVIMMMVGIEFEPSS